MVWKQQKWPAKVRVFYSAWIELSWAILFTCVMCRYVNSRLAETECVGEGVRLKEFRWKLSGVH